MSPAAVLADDVITRQGTVPGCATGCNRFRRGSPVESGPTRPVLSVQRCADYPPRSPYGGSAPAVGAGSIPDPAMTDLADLLASIRGGEDSKLELKEVLVCGGRFGFGGRKQRAFSDLAEVFISDIKDGARLHRTSVCTAQ